jgi:phosphate transport system permease protein
MTNRVQSAASVAKRYRAERRFKFYGALALGISILFLGALVLDIVIKAIPAFHENKIVLSVVLDPAAVDATAPMKGDYSAIVKKSLRDAFPQVTSRADKKKLATLLSGGAADDLRALVVANPALVGSTLTVPLLLSDHSDLYLKGTFGSPTRRAGKGTLNFSEAGKTIAISGDVAELKMGQILQVNDGALRIANVASGTVTGEIVSGLSSLNAASADTWSVLTMAVAEADRPVDDQEMFWLESLKDKGLVRNSLATRLLTASDSREAETAGLRGAIVGSLLTIALTLGISLPIGVAAAVYLEQFAPKNRFTTFLEVNINNLAAVPSIIFGLLGLAIFLNFMHLPRSAPLVGGLVLALLVLPTIIIASRAALKAVPPSIKEAAMGVGASDQQAVFHHILPLAVPGILTGTILGVARALGETAPLLMIGMVAFIVDVPKGLTDAATVLPVQIYLWSDLPELAFQSRTAAAIVVLLVLLFMLNGLAIYLRKKFEQRW